MFDKVWTDSIVPENPKQFSGKIEAIRWLRLRIEYGKGIGLREAKEAVEAIQAIPPYNAPVMVAKAELDAANARVRLLEARLEAEQNLADDLLKIITDLRTR